MTPGLDICRRKGKVLVVAPTTAFLDENEARWIVFVNLRDFWERDRQTDFTKATDHIVDVLHRYLDALDMEPEPRQDRFAGIASEINQAMTGLMQVIVPNSMYRPGADWEDVSDRISTKPFLFGNLEGVAGAYASLGRFLTCRYVGRLKRCTNCRGIFIAPDDPGPATCPPGPAGGHRPA